MINDRAQTIISFVFAKFRISTQGTAAGDTERLPTVIAECFVLRPNSVSKARSRKRSCCVGGGSGSR